MLTSTDFGAFREELLGLVEKFDKDKSHYLSMGYPEAGLCIFFDVVVA